MASGWLAKQEILSGWIGVKVSFVSENIWLIVLAIGTFVALIWPMLARGSAGVASVSVTEAVVMMSRLKPLIVDVREPAEFAQGHIAGARNIPLAQLDAQLPALTKYKDKPVLLVCQSGMRTKSACAILKAQQFSVLHQLQGGINAWQAAKMPVMK